VCVYVCVCVCVCVCLFIGDECESVCSYCLMYQYFTTMLLCECFVVLSGESEIFDVDIRCCNLTLRLPSICVKASCHQRRLTVISFSLPV